MSNKIQLARETTPFAQVVREFVGPGTRSLGTRGKKDQAPLPHPPGVNSATGLITPAFFSTVTLLKLIQFSQAALDILKPLSCLAFLIFLALGTVGAIFYLFWLGFL